jgi:hypothetical protein
VEAVAKLVEGGDGVVKGKQGGGAAPRKVARASSSPVRIRNLTPRTVSSSEKKEEAFLASLA